MPTLNFKGKSFVYNHLLGVPYLELVPIKKASRTNQGSLNDMLFLHEDNRRSLIAMLLVYSPLSQELTQLPYSGSNGM